MRNTLVIVGAGFSGTVLAANLLRRPPLDPIDIVLIERGSAMGRGVAYAARDFPYLRRLIADGRTTASASMPSTARTIDDGSGSTVMAPNNPWVSSPGPALK